MTDLPRFESYGNAGSTNYGLNSLKFYTPEGTFWFSYKTLVAFKKLGCNLICQENVWGPTTGKHLNIIEPDKSQRYTAAAFQTIYDEEFSS